MRSRCDDANPACLSRSRLSTNNDLDVLVERRQQVHQAFDRETRELVVAECGDFRLRHSQHLRGLGLRQLALFDHLIECIRQAQFCLSLGRIRIPNIRKNALAAANDPGFVISVSACYRDPRSLFGPSSSGQPRVQPCTPLDTPCPHTTPRSPGPQHQAPSTVWLSVRCRRTARCRERFPIRPSPRAGTQGSHAWTIRPT